MPIHREIELKLTIAPEDVERLRAHPLLAARAQQAPTLSRLENRYFDTADRLLESHRVALRLRRVGRQWFQTVKTDDAQGGAISARGEWEMPVAHGRIELDKLAATPLLTLAPQAVLARSLKPVFSTDFERESWDLSFDDRTRATFTIDRGEIRAGARTNLRTEPICEVEIELEDGNPQTLLDFVRRLSRSVALTPSTRSKAARGHALADGMAAKPIKLHFAAHDAAAGAALQRFVYEAVHALSDNAHGLTGTDDPEFVHQARVALRRLRSVLRAHQPWLGAWRTDKLERRLQRVGHILGAARDLDVFCLQTLPELNLPHDLAAFAQPHRTRALADARAAVRDGLLGRALLDMEDFALKLDAADLPTCLVCARRILPRLHRRVRHRARRLALLDAPGLHRLRIAVKHLRYGLDFYGAIDGIAKSDDYQRILARLQDALGALNDLRTACRLAAQFDDWPASMQELLAERADSATRERLPKIAALLVELELAAAPWRDQS